MLKITIVGLPNAGKSTLFNRLVGHASSIVSSIPGITRDRREGIGRISDLEFLIIDTGGWNHQNRFSQQVIKQIEYSLLQAHIILFLVDTLVYNDQNIEFAKWLKTTNNKFIILIGNKCESNKSYNINYLQYFNFIGPVYISAEHNLGMADLYESLSQAIYIVNQIHKLDNDQDHKSNKLRIAIIGRPNVGKSTFINRLLLENRIIVSEEPGTTRDSIDILFPYKGLLITLIDTAGIRKKSNIIDTLELRFVNKSIDAIKRSHVIIFMIDSMIGIEHQDLAIIDTVIKLGKGIMLVLNKWDLIKKNDRSRLIKLVMHQEINRLYLTVSTITISALTGMRCTNVIDQCIKIYHALNNKINTSKLNKWLISSVKKHTHPMINGREVNMKYIVQIGTSPPAFAIICNFPDKIQESYKRYLVNDMRNFFFICGIPIRILFKKSKNPYIE
ncbi:ribosome biogenesis GTPase Der [Wolbachia endosymbiont of Howardula sp.]|uniref:ribosome biogenesis GTPase Der n=1 Tax=Wolbachia endosymbiont of Howardula sp. TaxID=2916816 RepID=UPI00217F1094|nr:ribosome biogenesis GTPase Der [Wolbachia endosymbiont of Howardula sp.]UWI83039.1 ribosome biogenesis GTPase Der [Wolbachia endosymbiont of Howardula sp.]